MRYFVITKDPEDLIRWSSRFYHNNIRWFIKQVYELGNEPELEIHAIFEKPDNKTTRDMCDLLGTKECYLYFDTSEEWP